jgi:hypothetical protein
MFLSFKQKRNIFRSFPELTEVTDKTGRISYNFEGSRQKRKQLVRELTHTGNGYIYGGFLPEYRHLIDDRGWINIRDFSESELREIVAKVIRSFS